MEWGWHHPWLRSAMPCHLSPKAWHPTGPAAMMRHHHHYYKSKIWIKSQCCGNQSWYVCSTLLYSTLHEIPIKEGNAVRKGKILIFCNVFSSSTTAFESLSYGDITPHRLFYAARIPLLIAPCGNTAYSDPKLSLIPSFQEFDHDAFPCFVTELPEERIRSIQGRFMGLLLVYFSQ